MAPWRLGTIDANAPPTLTHPQGVHMTNDSSCHKNKTHIIVADDDPEMRTVISELLRSDDYDVEEIEDGGRLLVRVAGRYAVDKWYHPIDLIISDICMPVINGLDISKGIRDAHWNTPLILISSFVDQEIKKYAQKLHAILLEKPFNFTQLKQEVKLALQQTSTA
jgi:adenylate cyclase